MNKILLKAQPRNTLFTGEHTMHDHLLVACCNLAPMEFFPFAFGLSAQTGLCALLSIYRHAGSSRVAEKLAKDLHGRIKIEDAGFDWKVRACRLENCRVRA